MPLAPVPNKVGTVCCGMTKVLVGFSHLASMPQFYALTDVSKASVQAGMDQRTFLVVHEAVRGINPCFMAHVGEEATIVSTPVDCLGVGSFGLRHHAIQRRDFRQNSH